MEQQVIFRDRQEMQAADLNNLQSFARASIDHLITDAICSGKAYAGLGVTKTAATQAQVGGGRFYNGGAVYALNTPVTLDFFNNLPLVTQKYVAVVVYGTEVQTDVQPRDFLIDATAGTTEPESVSMQRFRQANISVVAGTEGPAPSFPIIDATVTPVAYVLLNTGGIVSITQITDTQLPSFPEVESQVQDIDAWRAAVSTQVDTLQTSLSALAASLKQYASENEVAQLTNAVHNISTAVSNMAGQISDLATWRAEIGQQVNDLIANLKNYATAASISALTAQLNALLAANNKIQMLFYGTDYFLDESGSDTSHGSYAAKIVESITFPDGSSETITMELLNPIEPLVFVHTDGFCLPRHAISIRDYVQGAGGLGVYNVSFNAYHYHSALPCQRLHRGRHRRRCGPPFQPNSSSTWWKSGQNDPIASCLRFDHDFDADDDSFVVQTMQDFLAINSVGTPDVGVGFYYGCRNNTFWEDRYSEPHWDRRIDAFNVTGYVYAQCFLNAQDGWLRQIQINFHQLDSHGDVTVKVCHLTTAGHPDLSRVIGHTTIPFASLYPLNGINIPLPPTFLMGGTRYAVVVTTPGSHVLYGGAFNSSTAARNAASGYTQWFLTDTGVWSQVNDRQAFMSFGYAKWDAGLFQVQFQPLSLAGGIAAIDILAEAHVPGACKLNYEVQIGGIWFPIAAIGGPDLTALPALLPFRCSFHGTLDMMPGFCIPKVQIKCSKGAGALNWFSHSTPLAANSKNFKFVTTLRGFDSAHHTCAIKMIEGSNTHTADTVSDVTNPDGSLTRTTTYTLGSAVAGPFVVNVQGATDSAVLPFHVSEISKFAG